VFDNGAAVDGDHTAIERGGSYAMKDGFRPFVIDIVATNDHTRCSSPVPLRSQTHVPQWKP
jgi:hypothetical protein